MAKSEHVSRMPTGERPMRFSMKSAVNRSANMTSEVMTNRSLPSPGVRMLPVMF